MAVTTLLSLGSSHGSGIVDVEAIDVFNGFSSNLLGHTCGVLVHERQHDLGAAPNIPGSLASLGNNDREDFCMPNRGYESNRLQYQSVSILDPAGQVSDVLPRSFVDHKRR